MMRAAVMAVLFASCRTEVTEPPQRQPLTPSGQPVAQGPAPRTDDTRDDRTIEEQLPLSLYAQNNRKKTPTMKPTTPPPINATPAPVKVAPRIAPITNALCVTTGVAKLGAKIDKPAMRAVAKGTDGEAAALTFTFRGETETQKKLSSGELRRQLGLKLRAENGCNLIYVMWRLDPKPMIYVQTKQNPGAKDHKACGTGGYKKVKPTEDKPPPELKLGEKHALRAEITDNTLEVFIDGDRYWRGALPDSAKSLRGPAGIRSDNLAFDLVSFDATTTGIDAGNAKCVDADHD